MWTNSAGYQVNFVRREKCDKTCVKMWQNSGKSESILKQAPSVEGHTTTIYKNVL